MVTSCVAYGCTNRLKKRSGLTFHLFPKNAEVRSLWERAVRREGWRAKDGDRLCSVHFSPECFDRTGQTTRLRVGSVPTSFPAFPPHLQKPVKRKRPDPKSRDFPAPSGPECSGLCDLPGDETFPEDSPTKQFYKDKVLSSQEEITQLKKKVKTLQQTKRRLVKRNESAQEIIKEIREQKLLSEEGSHVFSSVFSDDIQQLLCRVGNEQKVQPRTSIYDPSSTKPSHPSEH
ncbi:THAP domain-containing protein 1-like [Rhipicephalus microplus]|uniref:THAP domain-containing protein 1-like n=1 Tax=Rhipicephalus microplus TaxID=6941 RepID=UPI003F6D4BA5